MEVNREAETEERTKQLKELCEGIDQVNGLLVARTRRQDSVADEVAMQRGRRIHRWGESVTSLHMTIKFCVRMGAKGSRIVERFAENSRTF